MKLIVGLGNPGQEYKDMRHNIGFTILDKISDELKLEFKRDRISNSSLVKDSKREIILVKPETFMNLSGQAVVKLVKNYDIDLDNVLVIYDDVDLSFGRLKFSFNTSSGGHNGVESIISYLESKKFCRLRFGIDKNKNIDTSNFVLSRFKKEELKKLQCLTDDASKAAMFWQEFGIKKAMDQYNKIEIEKE